MASFLLEASQTSYPQTPPFTACTNTSSECLSRCMCVDHLSSSDPLTSEVFLQWNFLPMVHLLPNLPQNAPLRHFSFLKQLPSPVPVNSYISMYHHQHQCLLPLLLHVSENFPNMNGRERSLMSCSLLFSQHFTQ